MQKRAIQETAEAGDAAGRQPDERKKEVIFKNCALFILTA